jgi:hypothetical protein
VTVNGFKISTFVFMCCAAAWLPTVARADLIDGSLLHFSGDLTAGAISLTWHCNQPGDTACTSAPANQGDFAVSASTGSFAEYNGTFGLITDINNAAQPLNTPFSLPDFITFDLNSDITIELTFIPLGNDTVSATCAGLSHCTPQSDLLITPSNPEGLSADDLDSNLSGTALSFGVTGIVHQAGGATATLNGLYSEEFVGLNPQQALALTESGSNANYLANLSLTVTQTNVPEPRLMLLSAIGLLGLAMVGRRAKSS